MRSNPVVSRQFNSNTGVEFFPNGTSTLNDTATIDLSNRPNVTITEIQYMGPNELQSVNAASGLVSYNNGGVPGKYYLTDTGAGINEMYLDSARTQPLTIANYIASEGMPGGDLGENAFKMDFERPPYTTTHNILESSKLLNDRERIIYINVDMVSPIEDSPITFFAGSTWYYLEYITGTSSPWKYKVWEDAAYTQKQTVDWQVSIPTTDIQYNAAYNQYLPPGIGLGWNSSQLRLQTNLQNSLLNANITNISGNGQNLANTQYYYDQQSIWYTNTSSFAPLFTDSAKTLPLDVHSIVGGAGLTKTFKFEASVRYNGASNNFRTLAATPGVTVPFNRLVSIDSVDYTGDWLQFNTMAERKFIFDDTDLPTNSNKIMSQAGLLTSGTDYYLDFVGSEYGVVGRPGNALYNNIALFEAFNESDAEPYNATQIGNANLYAGAGPFTPVAPFPDEATLISGDESLTLIIQLQ